MIENWLDKNIIIFIHICICCWTSILPIRDIALCTKVCLVFLLRNMIFQLAKLHAIIKSLYFFSISLPPLLSNDVSCEKITNRFGKQISYK